MGYTIPVGDYLYRPEIPGRLLRYFGEQQHYTKRYLKHLHRIYESRRLKNPQDPYLVELRCSIRETIHDLEARRDCILQIHILLNVARPGRRPRNMRPIEGEVREALLLSGEVGEA